MDPVAEEGLSVLRASLVCRMQWVQKGSASLIYFNSDLPGLLGAYSCTDAKTITMTAQDMNEVSRMGCMPASQPMVQGELNPPFDGKLSDFSLTVKNPGVRTPSTTPIKALPLQILFKLEEGRVDVSMIFSRLRSLGIYRWYTGWWMKTGAIYIQEVKKPKCGPQPLN